MISKEDSRHHYTAPDPPRVWGWVQCLVLRYLRLRYGGNVRALKPPIGWHPDFHHPRFHKKLSYWFNYRIWRFDSRLFERYGQPMRDAWDDSVSKQNTQTQAPAPEKP